MKLISTGVPIKRISPADQEMFFGYYDLNPYDATGKLHLAHRTPFADRLQVRGDKAELGFIELATGKFEVVAETEAWNFQQGAMLQWNPRNPGEEILFNTYDGKEYHGTCLNIKTGARRDYEMPFANVSKDGKWAISINFHRLYDFRPGYGYASNGDPFYWEKHSDKDGVFIINLETGETKLVLSLQQIWDYSGAFFGGRDEKMIINHITFNPSATRFLALVRNFPKKGERHDTLLLTANRDGSDLFTLSDYGIQSHYWWKDDKHVVFYNDGKELDCTCGWANNYILEDQSYNGELMAEGFFTEDNHMSYSPVDPTKMITDTYWDAKDMRHLQLADFSKDICWELGRFYSPWKEELVDIRCDLHPRWKADGQTVSFDSIHEGYRGIYEVDLAELV